MMYLIFVIICIILNSIKINVKDSEVFVIERLGKFKKKLEPKGKTYIIPFVDRIKYIVNMEKQIIECLPSEIVLPDNKIIKYKNIISFHITDVQKTIYEPKNDIEVELENLSNFLVDNIYRTIDSSNMEHIIYKLKLEVKDRLSKEAEKYGCEIDFFDIKILKIIDENVETIKRLKYTDELRNNVNHMRQHAIRLYNTLDRKSEPMDVLVKLLVLIFGIGYVISRVLFK